MKNSSIDWTSRRTLERIRQEYKKLVTPSLVSDTGETVIPISLLKFFENNDNEDIEAI